MQAIFLLIYWWQREKEPVTRRALMVAIIMVGVTLLVSGSRASAVGMCVGLLIFLKGNAKIRKVSLGRRWTLGLMLITTYLMASYVFPEYLGSLFRSETSSRTILWERAWILSEGSRWLGVGFAGSDGLFAQDARYLKSIGIYVAGSHSSPMKLLVDLGFLGVLLAGIPFVLVIHQTWRFLPWFEDPNLGIALLALIGASLTNTLFEGWLFGFGSASTVPFWLFLAVITHQLYQTRVRVRYAQKYARHAYPAPNLYGANGEKKRTRGLNKPSVRRVMENSRQAVSTRR
jgi:phosphatidylglycerophosphate synthase